MKSSSKVYFFSKLKLIYALFIIFGFVLINIESKAHQRGYYPSKIEAEEKQ